ncbi:beta-glucanase [Apiospora kogelbergensis]|uniref:beta-glucanase n=1 Tax=Apiospora kogelbergensis TaxID=1337665 RepID=UPI00312D9994
MAYRFSILALLAAAGPSMVQAAVPSVNGFTLAWSDDFEGGAGSLPKAENWIFTTGTQYPNGAANFGTGEIQTYTKDPKNVQLDGKGNVKITAIKNGNAWTSARIETQRKDFVAPVGGKMRIQASLSTPKVAQPLGYWPAFWTLGAAFRGVYTNWPIVGEFDILENVNGEDKVYATLHCGTAPGGPCNENEGIGGSKTGCPNGPCPANFHTYALEVDRSAGEGREKMTWFVDDVQYHQILPGKVEASAWKEAVTKPHFLLMNLAIGGAFPNKGGKTTPVADTTSGGVFSAAYVAVYYSTGAGNATTHAAPARGGKGGKLGAKYFS